MAIKTNDAKVLHTSMHMINGALNDMRMDVPEPILSQMMSLASRWVACGPPYAMNLPDNSPAMNSIRSEFSVADVKETMRLYSTLQAYRHVTNYFRFDSSFTNLEVWQASELWTLSIDTKEFYALTSIKNLAVAAHNGYICTQDYWSSNVMNSNQQYILNAHLFRQDFQERFYGLIEVIRNPQPQQGQDETQPFMAISSFDGDGDASNSNEDDSGSTNDGYNSNGRDKKPDFWLKDGFSENVNIEDTNSPLWLCQGSRGQTIVDQTTPFEALPMTNDLLIEIQLGASDSEAFIATQASLLVQAIGTSPFPNDADSLNLNEWSQDDNKAVLLVSCSF